MEIRTAYLTQADLAAIVGRDRLVAAAPVAIAVLGEGDAAVVITAIAGHIAGSAITVALVDPGSASQSLSVAIPTPPGTAIEVTLATDSTSAVTTTAADLVAKLDRDANALVTSALAAESDGAGVVEAADETRLAPAPQPTTWDTGRVQLALDDVADRIDGRIRRRYPLPLPLERVPGFLQRAAAWAALGVLVDECTTTDLITSRVEEAWKVVSDVASGRLRIPGMPPSNRYGRALTPPAPDTPFSRARLRGII